MLQIQQTDFFADRHIGPNPTETDAMLRTIGVDSLETLMHETVPTAIRKHGELALPAALSEHEYLTMLRGIANKNKVFRT